MTNPVKVILGCPSEHHAWVKYTVDTLMMPRGVVPRYSTVVRDASNCVRYLAPNAYDACSLAGVKLRYLPHLWQASAQSQRTLLKDQVAAWQQVGSWRADGTVPMVDVIWMAFQLLASADEQRTGTRRAARGTYTGSVFEELRIPQDLGERCSAWLILRLMEAGIVPNDRADFAGKWPMDAKYVIVLSHDVDFVPEGPLDTAKQCIKTLFRHAVKERSARETLLAARGMLSAVANGRDLYGCVPEIIDRERSLGVKSSFQVAVGHRHPEDVNYRIEKDATRDYLKAIVDAEFDLCLHGSYRATESLEWYRDEVALLTNRLGRPSGSRQHFLSFCYEALFACLEATELEFDMSMGYPDHTGARNGLLHPYFPFSMTEERAFDVVELPLVLMDVTLRAYMKMKHEAAWEHIRSVVDQIARTGGCGSIVWHPIVFGNARDPGYGELYWKLIDYVQDTGGLATDGATMNRHWRVRAARYDSFRDLPRVAVARNHAGSNSNDAALDLGTTGNA